MSYYDNEFDIDQDIGDELYGEYNPDENVDMTVSSAEDSDIYEQMFREFNTKDQDLINLKGDKNDDLIPDDILMQINIEDDISRDDKDIDDLIDKGLEIRFFQNDPNSFLNSRVGIAERIGQEQTLGTIIQGNDKLAKRQEKINMMNLNTQQLFIINFNKSCNKYGIEKSNVNSLLELLFKTQHYEYKNPFGLIFGFMCLKGKNISEKLLNDVYKNYAINENISILDLLRYARYIKSLY
jgi:hypothetical protein